MIVLLLACFSTEPDVPPPAEVAKVQAERELHEQLARPAPPTEATYSRREGVYVDLAWFGGRSYARTHEELGRQFGALVEETPLRNRKGTTYHYEKGWVRVEGDTIVGLSLPLPQPTEPEAALRLAGFVVGAPPPWIQFSGELRLTNQYGFRRLILTRVEPRAAEVNRVDAWQRDPTPGG